LTDILKGNEGKEIMNIAKSLMLNLRGLHFLMYADMLEVHGRGAFALEQSLVCSLTFEMKNP